MRKLLNEKSGVKVEVKIQDRIKMLREKIRGYWEIHDIDYGTIHSSIFHALYIKGGGLSYYAIALAFYISKATVERYAIRYNTLALKLIEKDYSELLPLLK